MAFTSLFGTEVLALKAFVVLIFVLITLVSCRIDRQLGSRSRFHLFLVLAFLVYALRSDAPTTQLAILFLLVCFSAALTWRSPGVADGGGPILAALGSLVVGGAAAGLSFASKQNVGLLALSALVLVLMVESKGAGIRQRAAGLFAVALPFVLVIGVVSIPLLISGGWDKFIYYGFRDQGAYIRLAGVFYLPGLGILGELLAGIRSPEDLRLVYPYTAYLIPIAAFGALAVARVVMGPDPHGRGLVVLTFVTAGFLGMVPPAELAHLAYVLPPVLLGLGYGIRRVRPRLPPRLSRPLDAMVLLPLSLILAFNLVSPIRRAASDLFRISSLPHFRGVLNRSVHEERTLREAQALVDDVGRDRPFLLFPTASVHYLASGLDNPTPFDFPIAQVFGATGQQEIIAAVREGRVDVVCLEASEYPLTPVALERFVRQNLSPGLDVGPCTMYRSER
jgi:hypothetical protein